MTTRIVSTLLFWLMAAMGLATLAPALLLPAWYDYEAALQKRAAAEAAAQDLERRVAIVQRQTEHLQNDPAYVARLAQQEFGLTPPGVETIYIAPPLDEPPAAPPAATLQPGEEWVPEMSARVARFMRSYPGAAIFLQPRTRYGMMALGALMLVAALALLGPAESRSRNAEGRMQKAE